MDNYGTWLVIQYIITIPLAVYAFFFMPRRGTLSPYMENLRRNSAIFGLLPCGPFSLLLALLGEGVYFARIRSIQTKETALSARWSSPATSQGNPFGSSPSEPTPGRPSGNPFANPGDDENGSNASGGRANPFA